ncbi:MAG: hypothetical protein JXR37_19850 [Kiritimatiellae bacterium]|nr:hypothetical protein [Kiritimatiellia bacterium]
MNGRTCSLLTLIAAGWVLSAAYAGPASLSIESITVLEWNENNPPYPAMPLRVAAESEAATRRWAQVLVRYSAREELLGAELSVHALCETQDGRQVVLSGRKTRAVLHEAKKSYFLRLFVNPETVATLAEVKSVVVAIAHEGRIQDSVAYPKDADVARWEALPVLDGLLLDELEAPWAHLQDAPDGGLEARPRMPARPKGASPPDTGPPDSFLKVIRCLQAEKEGGARK